MKTISNIAAILMNARHTVEFVFNHGNKKTKKEKISMYVIRETEI